jgi:hypothetical protein
MTSTAAAQRLVLVKSPLFAKATTLSSPTLRSHIRCAVDLIVLVSYWA